MKIPDLDPINVAVWLAGLMLSQQAASYAGPYALIILAAICGATASLQKKESRAGMRNVWFVVWASMLAILFTVPFSTLVAAQVDSWDPQWFFMPMALLIGYQGDRVEQVVAFGKELLRRWLEPRDPQSPK